MYKNFFQLKLSPFSSSPDPSFMYMMPHTREALAALQYGITERKGFLILTGEVGTGKTTVLRKTLASLERQRVISSFVFNPRLDVLDFLEFILHDFGLTPVSRTKSGMLVQLNRWLIDCFRHDETCVIVVDEAQNLSWEMLEEIRLLTNLETSSDKLLQIILSGQPELEQKLRQPDLRQLRQRVSLWCRTYPLTEEQTKAYIEERLAIAGATRALFAPDALGLIHYLSQGIPRVINQICEQSLIFAYVDQVPFVSAAIIRAVSQDLDFPVPSSAETSPGNSSPTHPGQELPSRPKPG